MTEDAQKLLAQLQSLHWNDRLEVAAAFMDSLARDFRVVKECNFALQQRLLVLEKRAEQEADHG